MSERIVIPCGTDEQPRRHRWYWRRHHHGYEDQWCPWCGRWKSDVIETADERKRRLSA